MPKWPSQRLARGPEEVRRWEGEAGVGTRLVAGLDWETCIGLILP